MPAPFTRSRRLGLQLAVDVSGEDAAGVPFTETTRTVNVSGGGLCFEWPRSLPMGARLALHIRIPPGLRRHFADRAVYHVRAAVCRVERRLPEGPWRVGVRFMSELAE